MVEIVHGTAASRPMSDIFISRVEEDHRVVLEIATALEAAGFSTWFYERDSAVRAHESPKPFIPLRIGVTVAEYKQQQREWEEAIGAATSLAIPADGVAVIIPRILRGLEQLGIAPPGDIAPARGAAAR